MKWLEKALQVHARAGRMSRAGVGVGVGDSEGVTGQGGSVGEEMVGLSNAGGGSHCMGCRRGMKRRRKRRV